MAMTNEQLFEDLSQLVRQTVGASEDRLSGRIDGIEKEVRNIRNEMVDLRKDMHDGFDGIAQAIEDISSVIDSNQVETNKRLDDHDKRLTTLESQTA